MAGKYNAKDINRDTELYVLIEPFVCIRHLGSCEKGDTTQTNEVDEQRTGYNDSD